MTLLSFRVKNIDSIDPKVGPNNEANSLGIECRLSQEQMLDLLSKARSALPVDVWHAWLQEEA